MCEILNIDVPAVLVLPHSTHNIRMHAPTRNIRQLRHDLRNCPYHVFGDHSSCNPAFCKVRAGKDGEGNASSDTEDTTEDNTGTSSVNSPPITDTTTLQQQISDIIQQEKEDDMSPLTLPLQEEIEARSGYTASLDQLPDGLFFSVLRAGDRLVSLAEQLVDNQTSNLAECYMGLRTYFDGGKVYNRVQSGSFEGRCYAAGLRFQEGPHWITHTYQEVTGQQPPQPLVDVTNNYEKRTATDKKRKQSTQYKERRKRAKQQNSSNSLSNDYGPHAAQPDIPHEELQRLCFEYKKSLYLSQSERERIENSTREQAADSLRYEQRKCRLTASNFGIVARRRQTTPVAKFVKSLLYDTIREARPLQWGREHEQEARLAYLKAKGSLIVALSLMLIMVGWLAVQTILYKTTPPLWISMVLLSISVHTVHEIPL